MTPEDAQTAYNTDLQEAYGKVAAKVSVTLKKYVSDNGFTLLLDVSSQQSNVMWANQSTDVTQAVVTHTTPRPAWPRRCRLRRPHLRLQRLVLVLRLRRRQLRSQPHRSNSFRSHDFCRKGENEVTGLLSLCGFD